jgi:hypothetical protein
VAVVTVAARRVAVVTVTVAARHVEMVATVADPLLLARVDANAGKLKLS